MANTRILEESNPNDKTNQVNSRRIRSKIDLLDQKMDNLYKDIYISRTDDRRNLDDIIDGLDSALDRLQNGADMSVSTMSELIRRIDKKQNTATTQLFDSVTDLFTDQSLVGILASNDSIHKYIASENYTYDLICKYLPKLKLALEIKRDNVLCSDNFSKDYVNPQSSRSAKDEAQKFSINTKKLERKYEFSDFLDKTYMNVSRYGEDFIYIVPYQVAFKRVIKRSNQRSVSGNIYSGSLNVLGENFGYNSKSVEVVSESFVQSKEFKDFLEAVREEDTTLASDFIKNNDVKGGSVNLYFNDTGMVQSSVHEYTTLHEMSQMSKFKSLSSIYESTAIKEESDLEKKYKKVNDDNDGLTNASGKGIYQDGLIVPEDLLRDPDKIDKNFTGAVVERIPRENIIPVYMGDICFGYYHLEFGKDSTACGYCGGHHTGMPGLSNGNIYARETDEKQEELMLRYISARISSAIDTHFINANKDLKEEIYAILHYNEQFDVSRTNNIGVTFIPAEDIIHCYFELDENTHRGISDLKDSIVPAMLYILLYLTDIIGKITRSTDKRVYYVKQNVEQNIARTMMNVVKQIKKGNMGMRQIESMNNILNIVGKYNDYIIPQGPSGDPPIQFEIMPGQDIQTPSEIMDKMEESAINPIMPFEFLNSVMQQDFATRFTMSNTRFLKTIFTRQHKTEIFASKMYTKIYNYEFDEHFQQIEIVLPPPTYLVISNNSQLIDNVEQMADKISATYLDLEPDEIKAEFKKIYVRDALSTYIDYEKIERFIQVAKVNINAELDSATDDGEASDQYM